MPLGLAIGAGAGLLKSELVDAPKERRERTLAAATQKYSPWTGLQAQPIQQADPLGSAIQFGATGAALGSAINSANAANNYLNAKTAAGNFSGVPVINTGGTNYLSNGPWSGFSGPNPYSPTP
jgi:hypothetical protein